MVEVWPAGDLRPPVPDREATTIEIMISFPLALRIPVLRW
jgi:hypothetical protein